MTPTPIAVVIHITFVTMKLPAALFTVLLLQVFWATHSEGARILVLFPVAAPSHFILGNALVKGLVNKGHDVTYVNAYGAKIDKKNFKDVVLPGFVDYMEGVKKDMLRLNEMSIIEHFQIKRQMTEWLTESTINNTEVQNVLNSNERYDLVIMEAFMNEALIGFAHHYDCPIIIISTVGSNPMVNKYVGNPAPPSYVPQVMAGYTLNMNFYQRTMNFLLTYFMEITDALVSSPIQQRIMNKYFPTAPSINKVIQERVALVLLNSHPSISPAKPTVPNMIEIGGFHIAEPKPLPKDLKDYLDKAKQGFILFSMGSNIKSNMLPIKTREAIMKVLAQLPYQILWKFEDDQLPGKPDNVRIDKWLPQNDILAHPNLKLFITHGGLLSTTEAVYHGVPVVGIPVMADQAMNMAAAEALGIGKTVEFKDLSYDKLLAVVKEVLDNKSYREAARHRSALFRDQPLRPIDSAMYWIEYVLRHKYSEHLKTGAIYLSWYQVMSLDVMALIGSVVFAAVFIIYLTIRSIMKSCCRGSKSKITQQKKKD